MNDEHLLYLDATGMIIALFVGNCILYNIRCIFLHSRTIQVCNIHNGIEDHSIKVTDNGLIDHR